MSTKLIRLSDTAIIQRFFKHVNKNGPLPQWKEFMGACWLWTGATNDCGYPYFQIGDDTVSATHVSWELAHPWKRFPEGMDAAHLCDTPSCVNPDHLQEMPHDDNQLMSSLQRSLSPNNIAEIRAESGVSGLKLAERYGVDASTIYRVKAGDTWAGI